MTARPASWTIRMALALLVVALAAACDGAKEKKHERKERKAEERERREDRTANAPVPRKARDWALFPAVGEVQAEADIVGLGDVHGGYDRLVALLLGNHLIQASAQPGYRWTGGRTVLVSVGDLIDKGPQSVAVIDLLMALEVQARAAGGAVVVTLGNHEAEFLADPKNKKAKREFDHELRARGLDPETVAGGDGPYGAWLTSRPVAARVNAWFFAHAGNTAGASVAEIARAYREAVDGGHWDSPFLIGDDSILEAQKWWKRGDLDRSLGALGVRHLVFGHDPGAFDQPGRMTTKKDGKLVLIDVGMSPAIDYSAGALLVVHRRGGEEEAASVDATGRRTVLWRGPAP